MDDIIGSSDDIDTVYETCDSEFNSRIDVYRSFYAARGAASWARYYLIHEVQKICTRDGINLAWAARFRIATRIAEDWFTQMGAEEKCN